MKKYIVILLLAGLTSFVMGCHTAHGFGEDVERTGEKIQEKTPP